MAMDLKEIEKFIKEALPDASVDIQDLAGDGNHYSATIVSSQFCGKSKILWSTPGLGNVIPLLHRRRVSKQVKRVSRIPLDRIQGLRLGKERNPLLLLGGLVVQLRLFPCWIYLAGEMHIGLSGR